jgi:hypothetical protein
LLFSFVEIKGRRTGLTKMALRKQAACLIARATRQTGIKERRNAADNM